MKNIVIVFICLTFFFAYTPETSGADNASEEGEIIERIIEIKGTLEKPKVIFIIPKARLGKEGRSVKSQPKKSFIPDILKPVYPESLIKEEGLDGLSRR